MGINPLVSLGHDANITLLHHGEIVLFLNEERISRVKHDSQLPLTCLSKITDYTHTLDKILMCNIDMEERTNIT